MDEAWNKQNRQIVFELLTPDFRHNMPGLKDPLIGPDAYLTLIDIFAVAFPNGRMEIDEVFAGGPAPESCGRSPATMTASSRVWRRRAGPSNQLERTSALTQVLVQLYNRILRRFCALLLAATFGLELLSPLLHAAEPESSLPACCRRDGSHGCAKSKNSAAGKPSLVSGKTVCPQFPTAKTVPAESDRAAGVPARFSFLTPPGSTSELAEQLQLRYSLQLTGFAHKRGPPPRTA